MIVQWCVKGLSLESDEEAKALIDDRRGLLCNWWRAIDTITPVEVEQKLTYDNLDRHINQFGAKDPGTGTPFSLQTPFISLSAGTVERDMVRATNHVRRARHTALWFGSDFARNSVAYLVVCWVVVAPRPAIAVKGIAEEPRDLHTYRRYSPFQTEGEITAKIEVPAAQLHSVEKWEVDLPARRITHAWTDLNSVFTPPETLSNVREAI